MPLPPLRIGRATLVYVHDLIVTAIAFILALYLRVGDAAFGPYADALQVGAPILVVIAAVVYRQVGLYRGIWRYASVPDLVQLMKAVTISSLAFILVMFLLNRLDPIPRSVPLIAWFVQVVMLGGPRFAYRLFKDGRQLARNGAETGGDGRVPVLLIGTGDAAELFIRSIAHDPHAAYRVVGLLDENGRRVGREIRGVPVLGDADQLPAVVEELARRGIRPQRLILTRPPGETQGAGVRQLLDQSAALGLTLCRLPSLTEFKHAVDEGKGMVALRPIAIEDLLGRPQAVLDRRAIEGLIAGRRVLVTGAGGTIGSELTRQIAALNPAGLVLVDSGEFNLYSIDLELRERHPDLAVHAVIADVRERERTLRLFQEQQPELVFHAAALKHVPLVEINPVEGVMTNAIGTRNIADAARACGVRAMVMISTDKAVRPTSVMGATKRFAEAYCQALDVFALGDGLEKGGDGLEKGGDGLENSGAGGGSPTRFMTVRFGNVLGSSGSVVPLFRRQLDRGGPITVTHPDMRRYFMTVREAVELVLQASAHGVAHPDERGKIFVLDMGEPVRIVDLARQMVRLAGLRPEIDVSIEFTGLRPGEKLFEEILYAAEAPSRTEADGVFLAAPRVIDYPLLARAFHELEAAARGDDHTRMTAILGDIVPDYRPEPDTAARERAASEPNLQA